MRMSNKVLDCLINTVFICGVSLTGCRSTGFLADHRVPANGAVVTATTTPEVRGEHDEPITEDVRLVSYPKVRRDEPVRPVWRDSQLRDSMPANGELAIADHVGSFAPHGRGEDSPSSVLPNADSEAVVVSASRPIELGRSAGLSQTVPGSEFSGTFPVGPSDGPAPESIDKFGPQSIDEPVTPIAISAAHQLPIEAYVSMAMQANPRLNALRHRVASLANRVPQARALPDPMMQETFWPFNGNALETAGGRAANQIGISQQIPWPDKRRAKAAIACREVQIAEAELREATQEVAESVRLACIDIWFAEEALGVVDEFVDVVQQLNEVSEARYRSATKTSGQQDVLRARIEADRLDDRRVQLQRQKQVAQADLSALLHRPVERSPEVENSYGRQSLDIQLDELIGMAGTCNPSLAGLIAQIARDREKSRLACLQQYPDFQLGANWLMISDNNALSPVATGNDNFGFTLGVTLPIWRQKIRAGVAEASHQTQSSVGLLESEKDSVAGKMRRLVTQFDTFAEQLDILQDRIIPRTEDALEIALADYVGNRTDFSSVSDLYEERLLLELQRLALSRSQQAALIQLETLVGCGTPITGE